MHKWFLKTLGQKHHRNHRPSSRDSMHGLELTSRARLLTFWIEWQLFQRKHWLFRNNPCQGDDMKWCHLESRLRLPTPSQGEISRKLSGHESILFAFVLCICPPLGVQFIQAYTDGGWPQNITRDALGPLHESKNNTEWGFC